MTLYAVFGIAAGVVSFTSCYLYIRDILRGQAKPSKVTWWVLSLLNVAISAAYYSAGARDTIWISLSYALGFLIVGILSIRYGEGKWSKGDWIVLGGAIMSLLVWWLLRSAEVALLLLILTDFIGLTPTIIKSYKRPWTESAFPWGVALLASALNILAISVWTPAISAYPLYILITNALIFACILFSSHSKSQ